MDRINAMYLFSEVMASGSFSAASRKLKRPQTTISRQVKELEDYLGVKLLHRSTRNLVLTDAGEKYLKSARNLLFQISEVEREVKGEYEKPKGVLTLTAPVIMGRDHVFPLVAQYLAMFPEVSVRVILTDKNVHLYEDEVDVAVRVGHLPDSGLVAKQVGWVRKVICGSPSFLAKTGRPKTPEQLSLFDCITFEGLDSASEWRFIVQGEDLQVEITSRIIANSTDIAVHAAKNGLGLARVLSYQVRPWIRNEQLEEVLRDFAPPPLPVNLIYIRQGVLPLKLRSFIDFIAPKLRNSLIGYE